MKTKINLGLLNNPTTTKKGIAKVISNLGVKVEAMKLTQSRYKNNVEPTMVITIMNNKWNVKTLVEMLCVAFTQEAIPFKVNGKGDLAYHHQYKERFEFDDNLFID